MAFTYLIFNKPYEVLSSFTGQAGQNTLKDFIPVPGVYAAGRLDYRSEGLLLLTDDGPLINRLTDPRYEHPKTYLAQVEGVASQAAVEQLRLGINFGGLTTRPAVVEIVPEPDLPPRPVPVRGYHPTTWLKIVLREGKKHQVRRMTAAIGFPTLRLFRIAIGPVTLQGLEPGGWRYLTAEELRMLKNMKKISFSIGSS
jgi:23S rRNA pseudouridine2457 synthase